MTQATSSSPNVAIACGGTGGHLFPGLAVGERLAARGCRVWLVVSTKDVDQQAVKSAKGIGVLTVPAVGLVRGRWFSFARGFWRSYRMVSKAFAADPPGAALAMGGFTSAPPILAAKRIGARTFLHESNTIPGRANRWLGRVVDQAFVGFPAAANRMPGRGAVVTGTPVRTQFRPRAAAECRKLLGLESDLPVILVVGGSQGAAGINRLVTGALSLLGTLAERWQWLHLTGAADLETVRRAYAKSRTRAVVLPFLSEMDLALGAASVAISRAGASSLAEIAALRVPSLLIPYPSATDDHQLHNARAFADSGAALLLSQNEAAAAAVLGLLRQLLEDRALRERMQSSLTKWHAPQAADVIAARILEAIGTGVQDVKADIEPRGPRSQGRENRAEPLQLGSRAPLRLELQ